MEQAYGLAHPLLILQSTRESYTKIRVGKTQMYKHKQKCKNASRTISFIPLPPPRTDQLSGCCLQALMKHGCDIPDSLSESCRCVLAPPAISHGCWGPTDDAGKDSDPIARSRNCCITIEKAKLIQLSAPRQGNQHGVCEAILHRCHQTTLHIPRTVQPQRPLHGARCPAARTMSLGISGCRTDVSLAELGMGERSRAETVPTLSLKNTSAREEEVAESGGGSVCS